jgi:pilus assembly protein Flp/PilA
MTNLIKKLQANKSGASAAEYALIIALVGLAILVGAGALGTAINDNFQSAATEITNP